MFSAERQIKMGNVNSKEQEIGFSTEFFPSERVNAILRFTPGGLLRGRVCAV